jgi:hypothetical protein
MDFAIYLFEYMHFYSGSKTTYTIFHIRFFKISQMDKAITFKVAVILIFDY